MCTSVLFEVYRTQRIHKFLELVDCNINIAKPVVGFGLPIMGKRF